MGEISKYDFDALLAQIYEHGAKPELVYFPCGCTYNGVILNNGSPWYYCPKHSAINPPRGAYP